MQCSDFNGSNRDMGYIILCNFKTAADGGTEQSLISAYHDKRRNTFLETSFSYRRQTIIFTEKEKIYYLRYT